MRASVAISRLRLASRSIKPEGTLPDGLLTRPFFGPDLAAVRVGPHADPVVALGAIKGEAGRITGAVRDGDEVLIADAGADVFRAADIPDDAIRFAGPAHGDGAGITRSAAGVLAFDVVLADRIGGSCGDAEHKRCGDEQATHT